MIKTIELNPEVWEQLEILVERLNKGRTAEFKKSPTQVVSDLIRDRASVSDTRRNMQRRNKAWADYCYKFNIKPSIENERLFRAGYNKGWEQFQIRHQPEE